jgi:hypothetical protein
MARRKIRSFCCALTCSNVYPTAGAEVAASIVDVDASAVHACIASAGAKKLLMNAFCRADWELPISLPRNFSKLVSAAMSLPKIALRWAPFPSSRACAWP